MPVDPGRLRAFHAATVRADAEALAERPPERIASECAEALGAMSAWMAQHAQEVETGSYGGFARFAEVYRGTMERFRPVLVQSFALDAPDPGGVWGEAARLVATALPFVDAPRAFAVRALMGRPPFEPPGPLARRLLDLRAALADLERWKQREFQASWKEWGRLVWALEHQYAWICTNLGDPVTYEEVAFSPFEERLPRLRRAYEAKHATKDAPAP